jgi:hypothetical protein
MDEDLITVFRARQGSGLFRKYVPKSLEVMHESDGIALYLWYLGQGVTVILHIPQQAEELTIWIAGDQFFEMNVSNMGLQEIKIRFYLTTFQIGVVAVPGNPHPRMATIIHHLLHEWRMA